MKLPARAATPLSSGYRSEVDVTPELNSYDASLYQSYIGMLRWMVELGRIDMAVEVSMMSSHLALPREGHLSEVYHIFTYLKKHHNAEMVFDPKAFMTKIPFSVAQLTSMLSTPVPALAISFKLSAPEVRTSAVTLVADLTTNASNF